MDLPIPGLEHLPFRVPAGSIFSKCPIPTCPTPQRAGLNPRQLDLSEPLPLCHHGYCSIWNQAHHRFNVHGPGMNVRVQQEGALDHGRRLIWGENPMDPGFHQELSSLMLPNIIGIS